MGAFQTEKYILMQQKHLFEIKIYMVRSTLPYLCLWTGLWLILGVPALVHGFDTLTLIF